MTIDQAENDEWYETGLEIVSGASAGMAGDFYGSACKRICRDAER